MACPANSFQYNNTLCACNPGYIFNSTANNCSLFQSSPNDWTISSGIDYSISFSIPIFSFESIKKFTQSQAVFLQATLVLLLSWFVFCLVLRIGKINDGRSLRFRLRWWISRLDVCYATRHWLDDRKVVKKRKTELGGTFSIANWILFIGLFAALLYQIISRRSVEVHNVRASNGPDLLSFINDMEFNITTISSMSCSHLRGLGTLVTGTPGFDYRSSPLSIFANFSCHNTSRGPTIMIRCSNCKIARDDLYISWQFVDLPNNPATAVGFQFNFTAKNLHDRKHISFVTGTLKNGSNMDSRPITFRGPDVNILKFHLFPRIYHNLQGLRLIQPLFHEFTPGSSYLGTSQLQASLQSSQDGLINTTLAVNFLSAYIIEIDTENVLGPVGVLADLGGLYAISFAIFFYFLMQAPNFHFLAHSIQKILAELFFVAGMFVAPWAWTFPWFSLSKHLSQRGTFGFLFVLGWQMISGLRGGNLVRTSSHRCEFRIKKLRREDTVLINIRNRTKAKQNWDKLRKYVMYTWDCSSLKDVIKSNEEVPLCDCRGVKSSRASGSLHKRKQEIQMDTINLNKKGNLPTDMSTCSKLIQTQRVKSCSTGQLPDIETGLTCTEGEHVAGHEDSDTQIGKRSKDLAGSCQGDVSQPQASLLNDITLPLPPALEYKTDSGSDILDVQRNLQNLFEYNVLLREKFIASQSKLEALTKKASDPHCKCHNIT